MRNTKCPNNARAAKTPDANGRKLQLQMLYIESFKHSYTALITDLLKAMKPIYEDLSKDALLHRRLGGFTQNNNESLNHQFIWKISPVSEWHPYNC